MKKQCRLFAVLLSSVFLVAGCKKTTTPDGNTPKDYLASIADKTWWGTFNYTGQAEEYYSMHFNADNTFDWDQFLGSFKGFWALDSNKLTLTYEGNDTKIIAEISDDNKLIHISDNTDNSEITSGQLVSSPHIPLDNTVWKGMQIFTYVDNQDSFNDSMIVKLEFNDNGQALQSFKGILPPAFYDYSRSPSGDAVRTKTSYIGRSVMSGDIIYFFVIVSENEMKGTSRDWDFETKSQSIPLHITKQ